MGLKNGWLRNAAGELVLWSKGEEVMAVDGAKLGFFAVAPAAQQSHIADATDTSATDQKAPVNSGLAVDETFGLTATS